MKRFLSGDEAFAEGVRLARPQVISAYPITPQTVVVERLSEMVEDGSLAAEYVHVESEHSAERRTNSKGDHKDLKRRDGRNILLAENEWDDPA